MPRFKSNARSADAIRTSNGSQSAIRFSSCNHDPTSKNRRRDGGTAAIERQRDRETERRRDGETERVCIRELLHRPVPPSLHLSVSLSLCPSVPLSSGLFAPCPWSREEGGC